MEKDELQSLLRLVHQLACEGNTDAILEEIEPHIDTNWKDPKGEWEY